MSTKTEYKISFKVLGSKPSQNRKAFTWAWGRTEKEAIAQIRKHHGRVEILNVEAVRTVSQ